MRRKEISKELVRRIEKIYEETNVPVRTRSRNKKFLNKEGREARVCNESTLVYIFRI